MDNEVIVRVDHVYKDFRLPHEKTESIKNVFLHAMRYVRKNRVYELQHALKDISFEIKKGEFFGIVGRNGSGKSTLLKLIAGIYQPTKGAIQVAPVKVVPFIELGVGFNPELTGRENVYLNGALLGFSKKEIDAQYDDVVEFAELEKFMDQKLKNYSSGMQVRLAFSLAIRADADILIVDEVLAVGDASFQRKCFRYFKQLKADKKTVVFVTHNMAAVREYCDRVILIDDSRLKLDGDPEEVSREYSLLFIENETPKHGTGINDGERWGNGHVHIDDVSVSVTKKEISVKIKATARKTADKMIYGLHIAAQDGKEITAMNNRMIHAPDIIGLVAGSKIDLDWKMLNIFNDGTYFVTITLIDDEGTTLDWVTKAASFEVTTIERSTTAVLPPLTVTNKITQGKN